MNTVNTMVFFDIIIAFTFTGPLKGEPVLSQGYYRFVSLQLNIKYLFICQIYKLKIPRMKSSFYLLLKKSLLYHFSHCRFAYYFSAAFNWPVFYPQTTQKAIIRSIFRLIAFLCVCIIVLALSFSQRKRRWNR